MNTFKTVLVTGGSGYIDSHMVKAPAEAGHLPIALDNLSKGHRDAVLGGTFVKGDINESHPCSPTRPYGESKLCVEKLLESCRIAHGLQYASLRYFNAAGAEPSGLIGERHYPESHLIPMILDTAAGERDAVCIYGTDYPTPDGTCIMDSVHVNELVQAHLLPLDRLMIDGRSEIYNIGNSQGYSVKEVNGTAE